MCNHNDSLCLLLNSHAPFNVMRHSSSKSLILMQFFAFIDCAFLCLIEKSLMVLRSKVTFVTLFVKIGVSNSSQTSLSPMTLPMVDYEFKVPSMITDTSSVGSSSLTNLMTMITLLHAFTELLIALLHASCSSSCRTSARQKPFICMTRFM